MLIETERLLLRPMEMEDLDEFTALHLDPEVTRFIRRLDRAAAEERLRRDESEWLERGHGLLAVLDRRDGDFLGKCGLKYWPQFDETELYVMGDLTKDEYEMRCQAIAEELERIGPPLDPQIERADAILRDFKLADEVAQLRTGVNRGSKGGGGESQKARQTAWEWGRCQKRERRDSNPRPPA